MKRSVVWIRLLEVLVAVAIIGMLIALFLPAMQATRRAARLRRGSFGAHNMDASRSMGVAEAAEEPLPAEAALKRKIVYTAEVDLIVEDFEPVPEQVETLAEQFDAYVANSTVSGSPGSPRTGHWTIRVPVERYEEFLAAARQLGEVRRVSVDSQDVTEEYYDVEARIRNKKKTESRLLRHLEDATGKLEEILEVEKELDRVCEEIERVEGRLRVLKDLTSLTTIQLTVSEIKDYVPEEAASYATRVRRGFQASIATLVSAAQGLSIAVIVLLPWLVILLVLGVLSFALWRLVRTRRAG